MIITKKVKKNYKDITKIKNKSNNRKIIKILNIKKNN
jgi:hypothetical protein